MEILHINAQQLERTAIAKSIARYMAPYMATLDLLNIRKVIAYKTDS